MSEISLSLQKAIFAKLNVDLATMVHGRIYDRVPTNTEFPYVRLGSDHSYSENYSGAGDSGHVRLGLDVFSRANGKVETKTICGAIKRSLDEANLALENYTLVSLLHSDTRYLDDPDGLSTHGIVVFNALIDEE